MGKMMDKMIIHKSRYFEPEKEDIDWGLYCKGTGTCRAKAKGTMNAGRVLNDFAMVYLFGGEGRYYSSPENSIKVSSGDIIMLFPGIWHSYGPEKNGEWDEYWAIFNGDYMRMLTDRTFFSPELPLLHTGLDKTLMNLFVNLLEISAGQVPGFQKELAAELMKIFARIQFLLLSKKRKKNFSRMEKVIMQIENNYSENINLLKMAAELNMSYPHFRRMFREATGYAPHQYQLTVKINKAKEFLAGGKYTVKQTADMLGFDDQYYFSRVFRKKTGVAPSQWYGL
ncbi:MAG: hypothetical protein A2017_09495 [Lentisphaerae bacterium GWF2_44_16]|nr:MAG: hypothetical protein A2017_09495 [Lentisphaerae bacterium GWF2_44_16]